MGLSNSQISRLASEKNCLEDIFGDDFEFYISHNLEPCFRGWVTTAYGNNSYQLTLNLGSHFPYERPKLFVTCPSLLIKRGSGFINDLSTSHDFHTWDNGPGGCVQICHTRNWDAYHTCLSVINKGQMWLEFYEAYLKNGGCIDDYCN